jgi:hypothetical protein
MSTARCALVLLAACSAAGALRADEHAVQLRPPPEGLVAADFELWLPDGLGARPLHGLILVSDYEAGRGLYERPDWRAFAEAQSLGLLCHKLRTPAKERNLSKGEEGVRAIRAALAAPAVRAKRPELEHAGLIHTGLSQSGHQAVALSNRMPERTIAIVPFHESTATRAPEEAEREAGWAIPHLHVVGGRDALCKPAVFWPFLRKGRGRGASWSAILQPGVEHHKLGDDHRFIHLWLEEVLKRRVPDPPSRGPFPLLRPDPAASWAGVLKLSFGEKETTVAEAPILPLAGYRGAPTEAVWLPSESVAKAWLEYSRPPR